MKDTSVQQVAAAPARRRERLPGILQLPIWGFVLLAGGAISAPVQAESLFSKLKNAASDTLNQSLPEASVDEAKATLEQTELTSTGGAGEIDAFFASSPVFRYHAGVTLQDIKGDFPDLSYSSQTFTHDSTDTSNSAVSRISFNVFEDRLRDTTVHLRRGAGSSEEIAQAAKKLGYSLISEREIKLVGNHTNGSTFEAGTSRKEHKWRIAIGAANAPSPGQSIQLLPSATTASLGQLDNNAGVEVLQNHLRNFLNTSPLFQFKENTRLSTIKQFYPGIALMSGKTSQYEGKDSSLAIVDRVEFHTENDDRRLKWIGVYFRPNLDQKKMSQALSATLKEKYGTLVKDEATEHLARRKDYSNAFHTRWYFRQKQWGAGIYPPK